MNWQIFFSAAVGQTIWSDKKKAREDEHRSTNARIFIDSMLTDYKAQFAKYSDFKYEINGNDTINDGNLPDLFELFFSYIDSYIRETSTDYLTDLKFGIKNIGIQTDSHTIGAISDRFKAVNNIKTSIDAIYSLRGEDSKKYSEIDLAILIRKEMEKIDTALHILKQDLTDKDEK